MTAELVGTLVGGKYRVVSKIGTGSMGDVYEAEGPSGHVALKVLKVDDDTLAARFLREAKTMSLFQHPNIVELLEVGKLDDGRLFFAAELVRGITLRALLESGPVEIERALAIVRQVLDALGHAHAMGVVHRDIKPENVMLVDGGAPDGNSDLVKILDFGVAKLIGDTPAVLGEGTLTITGYGALGTPYYISPEAVLGRALDARADIYSIGVMLFELITGKPPYMHEDVAVLMRMHAAAPIPKLQERAPDRHVTPELELVVSEALAKKPELRFKTASEMISAIDAAARSLDQLFFADPPKKSTDVFGALPMKGPAQVGPSGASAPGGSSGQVASASVEPSASAPAAFSPSSIPSASQPVQPGPAHAHESAAHGGSAPTRKSASRIGLPGVAPDHTPVAGAPVAQPHTSTAGPVVGVVVPANGPMQDRASAPLFSPPMPHMPPRPKQPSKLAALAVQHKKYVIAGIGAFLLIIIIVIAVAAGGGDEAATDASSATASRSPAKRAELVKAAQEKIAAGLPAKALEILEAEPLGDDDDAFVVLGHARVTSNRRLDGVAAYERAIKLDKKHLADPQIREHLERILESRDAAAAIVAMELAIRMEPPLHDAIKRLAESSKNNDVRRRSFAVAEREKFAEGIDVVASRSLDLAQATTCEERLAAVLELKRMADPKALPALKRAKTHRCVEREVAEAIAQIEQQQPAKP